MRIIPMSEDSIQFTEWSEWLKEIWRELLHLAWVDDVFWQVQAIIGSNESINKMERFQRWIAHTYTQTSLTGLRRLVDRTKNTKSLSKLLDSMQSNADVLTRERYLNLHDGGIKQLANEWFDELAGGSFNHIPKSRIKSISENLVTGLENVSQYANDYVAHSAKTKKAEVIRFHDVRLAIVELFKVYKRCSRVLESSVPSSPVAVPQTEWLMYFRVPWLKDPETVPDYEHIDALIEEAEKQPL